MPVYFFASETEDNLPSEGICTLTLREKLTYGNYNVFALCIKAYLPSNFKGFKTF